MVARVVCMYAHIVCVCREKEVGMDGWTRGRSSSGGGCLPIENMASKRIHSFQPQPPPVRTSPPPANRYTQHHNAKQAGDPRSFGTVGAGNARERESNAYGGYGDEEEEEDNNVRVRFCVLCGGMCVCVNAGGERGSLSLCFTFLLYAHHAFLSFLCIQFGYGGGYPGMRGEHVQCSQQ